jgi:hypothetical protein
MTDRAVSGVPDTCGPNAGGRTSRLSVQVGDGVVTVRVTGRPDLRTVTAFRDELLDLCTVCVGDLVVDLSGCTGITMALMGVVDAARAASRRNRCTLLLHTAAPVRTTTPRTRARSGTRPTSVAVPALRSA